MDDVICYADKFETAYDNLKIVFQRLHEAELHLKPKKYRLFSRSIKFIGHVVSRDGVSPDPEKIEAVQTWPVPQNVTDLQSFLGFSSNYKKFIPNFLKIVCPLINLTQKGNKFDWTPDCQKAYRHWYAHNSDCESRVIVAPKQLLRELFHHLHELRTGGHLGIKRTVYQFQRRLYWPALQNDVRTWC